MDATQLVNMLYYDHIQQHCTSHITSCTHHHYYRRYTYFMYSRQVGGRTYCRRSE